MKNCLIYIISPTHVISTMSAIKTLHKDSINIKALIHHPYLPSKKANVIKKIIIDMLSAFPEVKETIYIEQDTVNLENKGRDIDNSISILKKRIKDHSFDEIYYTVDFVGNMTKALFTNYPNATKTTVGDAFGLIFDEELHCSLASNTPKPNKNKFRTMALTFIDYFRRKPQKMKRELANLACLILPVYQTKNCLMDIPLVVCKKDLVLNIIGSCRNNCQNFNKYVNHLYTVYMDVNKYLLLTDNFSEGSFLELGKEIEMYSEIIRKNCKSGDVIFIKPHPGDIYQKAKILQSNFSNLKIVELDRKYNRFPIEMWGKLVINSSVISLSYPILSLKYLYNIDVIKPLNTLFIKKWFPKWLWKSYINAMNLYMNPLKKLETWNGSSVIWKGDK